jgi:RecB family exonuclease
MQLYYFESQFEEIFFLAQSIRQGHKNLLLIIDQIKLDSIKIILNNQNYNQFFTYNDNSRQKIIDIELEFILSFINILYDNFLLRFSKNRSNYSHEATLYFLKLLYKLLQSEMKKDIIDFELLLRERSFTIDTIADLVNISESFPIIKSAIKIIIDINEKIPILQEKDIIDSTCLFINEILMKDYFNKNRISFDKAEKILFLMKEEKSHLKMNIKDHFLFLCNNLIFLDQDFITACNFHFFVNNATIQDNGIILKNTTNSIFRKIYYCTTASDWKISNGINRKFTDFLMKNAEIILTSDKKIAINYNFTTIDKSFCNNIQKTFKQNPLFKSETIIKLSKSLSPTAIQVLNQNPGYYFVTKILKLKEIEKFHNSPPGYCIGSLLHKIIEKFSYFFSDCKNYIEKINNSHHLIPGDQVLLEKFLEIAQYEFRNVLNIDCLSHPVWKGKVLNIAKKIIALERRSQNKTVKSEYNISLDLELASIKNKWQLRAKIDRIEFCGKTVAIYDFKTSMPTLTEERNGTKAQLSIIAFLLNELGYKVIKICYIDCSGLQDAKDIVIEDSEAISNLILSTKENINEIIDYYFENYNIEKFRPIKEVKQSYRYNEKINYIINSYLQSNFT